MATINFNTASKYADAPAHRVYTRSAWADLWTEQPSLACIQCTWNAAPDRSTAVIVRDYGRVLQPGGTATADLTPVSLEGSFVLIEWDTDEQVSSVPVINYWLGVIDGKADAPDGPSDGTIPASGRQSFTCYGMERLLQVAPVLDTVWDDDGASARSGGATAFNQGGKPNRSADVITDETYVFDHDTENAEFWSSRDIINHLLFYHLPTDDRNVASIPWELANASIVPDWDAPEIETEGMTVWDIINRLLDSRMLLGWGVGFDNTTLAVAPFSIAASSVTLADKSFAANATQHTLTYSADPLTIGEITVDRSDMVDQVIVRGARRVSVCTVRVDDGGLEAGWSTGEEDDYNEGFSGDGGYAALAVLAKRDANDRVRRDPLLADVFSLLNFPAAWTYTVKDGLTDENVFDPESGTDPHVPYRGAVRLLPRLPFIYGVDYSGDVADDPARVNGDLEPLVTFAKPGASGKVIDTKAIGQSVKTHPDNNQTIDYVVSVEPDPEKLALRLSVHGNHQHMIAGSDYTALADDDVAEAHWDILTASATVALTDDRYCEVVQPSTAPTTDVVRRRVFHVGDSYQQIYIVPGTVVGVDAADAEKTSNGGYLRDDSAKLNYLALLLKEYHTNPRTSLTLRTYRRTSTMSVGDMVASANGTTVGAVITRIQIDSPIGDGRGEPPKAIQQFVATAVPLDILTTLAVASRR